MSSISSINNFQTQYNNIPDMSSLEILMSLGIITTYTPLTVNNYAKNTSQNATGLNSDNLLGEDDTKSKEADPNISILSSFSMQNRENTRKKVLEKSDTSLEPILAKRAIRDDFRTAKTTVDKYSEHYLTVTQTENSYRIYIDRQNIPHLFGLPSVSSIRNNLNTEMTNYLASNNVNYNNYFDLVVAMLTDSNFKQTWFDNLFIDISQNNSFENKDNTDKIGYKRSCLELLLSSINIGSGLVPSRATETLTYVCNQSKKKIMSLVNIPNTDGYLGLISIFDDTLGCYLLYSIVALNSVDLQNYIIVSGSNLTKVQTTFTTNVTFIDSKNTVISQDQMQEKRREQLTDTNNNGIIYDFDDRYTNFDGTSNKTLIDGLKRVTFQIKNARSNSNKIFQKNIMDILNTSHLNGGYASDDFQRKLPKYLINLILTSNINYEDFIYNILVIMKNAATIDDNIVNVLNTFYSISKKDFQKLIGQKDKHYNSEPYNFSFSIIDDSNISISGEFKISIGKVSKVFTINIRDNIANIKNIKTYINKKFAEIYNTVFDVNLDLTLSKNNDGSLNYDDYIDYASTIRYLTELHRFVNASIYEIEEDNIKKGKRQH